jgi:hypothetical protein
MSEQRQNMGTANTSRGDASVGTEPPLYPVELAADSPAPIYPRHVQGAIMTGWNVTSPYFAGFVAIMATRDGVESYEHFMGISPP